MGGFNLPWGANAAPRMPSPQQGSMGGIQGPPPGLSPYPVNGVAQGAAALGQLFQQFGQMNEQQKAKDHQEFQDMMQLQSLGLPVDMVKMQKLGKKVFGKYIDFNNPMPQQPAQPPQGGQQTPETALAMPSQPNVPGAIGVSMNSQGQMGPAGAPPQGPPPGMLPGAGGPPPQGMPPGMGPQTPPFMPSSQMPQAGMSPQPRIAGVLPPGGTPPFMPPQQGQQSQQPPLWLRMAQMAGLAKDSPVNPQSAGAVAMQKMASQAQQSGQMQRAMTGMQFQGAMSDFALKQRTVQLTLAAAGVGENGQPLPPQAQYQAESMLRGMNSAIKGASPDAKDPLTLLHIAQGIGASPAQQSEVLNTWYRTVTDQDKKAEFQANTFEKLTKAGASPTAAIQTAQALWEGKPIPLGILPMMSPEHVKTAFDQMQKIRETFPTFSATPKPFQDRINALVMSGDVSTASKELDGLPTKELMDQAREKQQVGIAGMNAQTQQGQLSLGQQKFTFDQKADAQKQQHTQAMAGITALLDTHKMQGGKLTDDQWKSLFSLIPIATGLAVRPTMESGAAGHSWMTQGPSIEPNTPNRSGAKNLLGQAQPAESSQVIDWLHKFMDTAVEFK